MISLLTITVLLGAQLCNDNDNDNEFENCIAAPHTDMRLLKIALINSGYILVSHCNLLSSYLGLEG